MAACSSATAAASGSVGQALEELYRTVSTRSPNCWHFISAAATRREGGRLRHLAAEKAQRRWANSEAVAYFEDALSRLDYDARYRAEPAAPHRRRSKAGARSNTRWGGTLSTSELEEIGEIVDEMRTIPTAAPLGITGRGSCTADAGGRQSRHRALPRGSRRSRRLLAWRDRRICSLLSGQVTMVAGRLHERSKPASGCSQFEARGNPLVGRSNAVALELGNSKYLGEWEASLDYCRRGLEHGIALEDVRLKAVGWYAHGNGAHCQQGDPRTRTAMLQRGARACAHPA